MKKRFTELQITFALRQTDSETPVSEICRKMNVSEPTFYRWKKISLSVIKGSMGSSGADEPSNQMNGRVVYARRI